jgi:acyl-CoA synthetase (AMP-forming)/AMP-acid ligase II
MVSAAGFDDPGDDAATRRGAWLLTGDIGRLDGDGRLVVLDRRTDRLVVGGETVSPLAIERAIETHPAVLEACVVGIPAGAWGHEIAAAVTLRPATALPLHELRAHLSSTLASFQLPRRLRAVPALPRNGGGKLLRGEVRAWFGDEVAGENRP